MGYIYRIKILSFHKLEHGVVEDSKIFPSNMMQTAKDIGMAVSINQLLQVIIILIRY